MSAEWWRVTVNCRAEESDAVAAAIVTITGQGVDEPSVGVLGTVVATERAARALIHDLVQEFADVSASIGALEPVDWTVHWRDGILTRRFGRLILTPSWLPVTPAPGEVAVIIDPETAFGSGEHGSTRGALALLERHLRSGDAMLDFGSGSGILAIAAAALGARSAIGIEVDEDAVPIAEANAHRNGVAGRVTFLVGDAHELGRLAGPAHLICSNILRTVNTLLLPEIARALTQDGIAIFAGMEESEAELFRPVLGESGWSVVDELRDAGWWSVAARRV